MSDSEMSWDDFWRDQLQDDFWRRTHSIGLSAMTFEDYIPSFQGKVPLNLLVPGNGIYLMPYALAHMGHAVTALDISPLATEYLASHPLSMEGIARFLPAWKKKRSRLFGGYEHIYDEEASRERVQKEHVPGGGVVSLTASVFDFQPDVLFDGIIDVRFAQILPYEERGRLAALYRSWLAPEGVLILDTVNVGVQEGQRERFEAAFTDAGFVLVWPDSAGKAPRALASDERLAVTIYGSG